MSFWSRKPKHLTLTYDAPNNHNIFTAGDTVTGTFGFTLTKDTKVNGVNVKLKGSAHVYWTEGTGEDSTSYSDKRKFFKLNNVLVENKPKGTLLPKGEHVLKFKFQIPSGDLPPSFKSSYGQITYLLEAKICRTLKFPLKERKQLRLMSSWIPLQCPVSDSVRKGKVEMSATVDKKVCCPGDILSVVVNVCNSFSSKAVRPKFQFIKKEIYRARESKTSSKKSYEKVVGKYIAANSKETVSCQLRVPVDAVDSIYNCEILTVEYYVLAYVDISFAVDPEVKLPVVVVPARFASLPFQPGQAVLPCSAGAVGRPGYSDFPPQGPYCAPTSQSAYGYQARAPTQPALSTSGFNNQRSLQFPPHGDPLAAFHPQAPTAQPQEEEDPPHYATLFPSST